MNKLTLIVALLALGGVLYLISSGHKAHVPNIDRSQMEWNAEKEGHDHEDVEVAPYMARLHQYSNKLYAAASASNKPLTDFYLHEMEEVMEELVEEKVIDDGVNLSEQMEIFGLSAIDRFEAAIKDHGFKSVEQDHAELVISCNACHQATGYAIIQITSPQDRSVVGQDMLPRKGV